MVLYAEMRDLVQALSCVSISNLLKRTEEVLFLWRQWLPLKEGLDKYKPFLPLVCGIFFAIADRLLSQD